MVGAGWLGSTWGGELGRGGWGAHGAVGCRSHVLETVSVPATGEYLLSYVMKIVDQHTITLYIK